mmetsp:Transcript_69099/g.158617  ORF Transcript_69099/g.158617 Transcript_69099/m.158617 type:complete len:366 (+) Transcript_69099:269-1366(+)
MGAYTVSKEPILLQKAVDLGERLYKAVPRHGSTRLWPAAEFSVSTGETVDAGWTGGVILADVGSWGVEFSALSSASGDLRFQTAAVEGMKHLAGVAASARHHLIGMFLSAHSNRTTTSRVSVGACSDSYYEYLLKMWIQGGKKDAAMLQEWKDAMEEMRAGLMRTTPDGVTYLGQSSAWDYATQAYEEPSPHMEHLSCFVGGMLALGHHAVPPTQREAWWLPAAKNLTQTCYQMYQLTATGLAPDQVDFGSGRMEAPYGGDEVMFRMRPETLESLFVLHRVTGDEQYRQWSYKIFEAIQAHAKAPHGYATVRDVRHVNSGHVNSQETFVGAETLKYAYLIHLPDSVLPIDQYVFNTEAHPVPVQA